MKTQGKRFGPALRLRWLVAVVWLFCQPAVAEPVLELDISGVEGVLLENVRAHLSLSRYVRTLPGLPLPGMPGMSGTPALPGEHDLRAMHRRATREIRDALQPYGYYEPDVEASLEQAGERWRARYRITPGTPVTVAAVDIRITGEGEAEPAILAARDATRLRSGARLIHPDYDATRAALLRAALEEGYLDARYSRSELRVDPDAHRADLVLHLDTGPRYYFGPVTIEQDILSPAFIERYVKISEGEPFDTARLLDLQLALGDSGYFDHVELEARRESALDHHVPVVVHTLPGAHTRYRFGLGYGTDTGPRVTLGAEYRRINRRGHGVNTDLQLSPIQQTAGVHYTVPIRNMISDRLIFGIEAENAEVAATGQTRSYKLGVSQNVNLGLFQRLLYLNFQRERHTLGTTSEQVDFLIPGITGSKLKSDNVLFPRDGYSWNLDLRGAPGLISATRFARVEAALRGVRPLGSRGRFVARVQLGGMTVDDFSALPASERFFAGGDQSVRGYDYQTLAPRDINSEVIGGQYLAVASLEADYLFAGNFGAAVFVDAGNADDTFLPAPKIGAGIGFRWRSPVGMLRVDIAHPFDDPLNNYRLHISIGPDL